MNSSKIIFHIDMNAFFASVEMALNPTLVGKPIAVAHNDPLYRGIILSPNYEARKFGIKTTMLVKDALLLCNNLVIVEPKMEKYKEYSSKFFEYLYTITDKIEIASIDEAYLDVTDKFKEIHPLELAKNIQDKLYNEYKLPSSIGIAPNKFLAKMASDLKKPLGITVLRKREIDKYLWPLSIDEMFGVGKKTKQKLESIGIKTIGDLANFQNLYLLKETLGELTADSLYKHANGNDDSHVDPNSYSESQSISNSHTFTNNVFDPNYAKKTLKVIANTVSYRLKQENKKAQTIGLILKYANFKQINRSMSLDNATNNDKEIYSIVEDIFDEYFTQGDNIRLVGIFASRLIAATEDLKQYTIFDDPNVLDKEDGIQRLLKILKSEFGQDSINLGYYDYKEKEDKYGK
jgi:DNA polymerase-4